jgi:hypothetical protein
VPPPRFFHLGGIDECRCSLTGWIIAYCRRIAGSLLSPMARQLLPLAHWLFAVIASPPALLHRSPPFPIGLGLLCPPSLFLIRSGRYSAVSSALECSA